jgi:3-deoxy-D-manno-octulosonic-acid transferase
MSVFLDMLYLFGALAFSPIIAYRAIRYKRYRTGWAHRLGRIRRKDPAKKCIWLHAVSVGEVNASKTILSELHERFPHLEIVVSTTTDTGYACAAALFADKFEVFYFPFDFSWVTRRAFKKLRPAICLLMELEVWPNFLHTAESLCVPVLVINGRISDRSFTRYSKVKPLIRGIFRRLTLVLAQTDEYAERFVALGCPVDKVLVTGSLKYDTAQITDRVDGADVLMAQLFGKLKTQNSELKTPLWVAGATGDGEEQIILNVYRRLIERKEFADLRLVIVPRKPERFDEVADLIAQKGFVPIRYSQMKDKTPAIEKSSIINNQLSINVVLGDTMGDLRKFYSLATVIFVGRSLVPMGGSDMMEAAALGKCTIFGPHAFNFKQAVETLLKGNGAILVKDERELLETVAKCLLDPAFARRIAQNGREVIRKNQGATARTMEQIPRILNAV